MDIVKLDKKLIYAIIPARSESKGIPNKNIVDVGGKPLMAYSIEFAKKLSVDKIICSTDSEYYSNIATKYGAEVPFLRSPLASGDTAMEQDILNDLLEKFELYKIERPDIIVWLRPTFVFRDTKAVNKCVDILVNQPDYTAARTVCSSEGRLYRIKDGKLYADFEDQGKSMVRRQDIGARYKVYSTDVFRFVGNHFKDNFLGDNIAAVEVPKICGLDIDDEFDLMLVENLIKSKNDKIYEYL